MRFAVQLSRTVLLYVAMVTLLSMALDTVPVWLMVAVGLASGIATSEVAS